MEEQTKILLLLKFKNVETNAQLEVKVYEPVAHKHFSSLINEWCESLRSDVVISMNDEKAEHILGGDSWPEIIFLALEFTRQQIPIEEELKWVDERGVASWVVLPKTIPISWGYELHRKLADQVNSEVAKFVEQIDKKRRRYEDSKKV